MNLLKKTLLAGIIALSSFNSKAQNQENNKNHEKIIPLINYLNVRGFKADSLLKDPRFKIYPEICSIFKKAPEFSEGGLFITIRNWLDITIGQLFIGNR